MATEELPQYKEWESLVAENWNHWQYYIDLYSYSLQKPARSFFTSMLYPGFYQERLLRHEFVSAMQAIGTVKEDELKEYSRITDDKNLESAFKYIVKGPLAPSIRLNPTGIVAGFAATFLAALVKKPVVWCIVPGVMIFAACNGIENRFNRLRLGRVVDLAHWTAESRKAIIWLEEKKQDKQEKLGQVTLQQLEGNFVRLIARSSG